MDPQERNHAHLWDMRDSAKTVTKFLDGVTYSHRLAHCNHQYP